MLGYHEFIRTGTLSKKVIQLIGLPTTKMTIKFGFFFKVYEIINIYIFSKDKSLLAKFGFKKFLIKDDVFWSK